jgi:BMFP domain-containing protein YqiC
METPRPGRPPFSDLPEKLLAALRSSPAAELEEHVKALVAQAADKMDLVPREEFEIQKAMLEKLQKRVEELEATHGQ